jgi:hypothetical protein
MTFARTARTTDCMLHYTYFDATICSDSPAVVLLCATAVALHVAGLTREAVATDDGISTRRPRPNTELPLRWPLRCPGTWRTCSAALCWFLRWAFEERRPCGSFFAYLLFLPLEPARGDVRLGNLSSRPTARLLSFSLPSSLTCYCVYIATCTALSGEDVFRRPGRRRPS